MNWDDWVDDYGLVRDLIAETYPKDFHDFSAREMFDADEGIEHGTYADKLVEFNLNRSAIAVLRVLNKEDPSKT